MGVAAILPVVTARTEISVAALTRGRRRERWDRIAVSSAKQCGRAVVPSIAEPAQFDPLTHSKDTLPSPVFMLVEPNIAGGVPLGALDATAIPARATLFVGPEGGWTADEVQAASAIGTLITLGRRTLRADAMALVALAALFAKYGEY
jgi:16S rRNA (uracil1498-N3)-methyltransferase